MRLPCSRPGPPQRLHALTPSAALWSQVVRHLAGTVRLLGRELPPTGRLWLPCLTQWSPSTVAHRPPRDAVPRSAPTGCPGPPGRQRDALEPSCAGLPPASIVATKPSSADVG